MQDICVNISENLMGKTRQAQQTQDTFLVLARGRIEAGGPKMGEPGWRQILSRMGPWSFGRLQAETDFASESRLADRPCMCPKKNRLNLQQPGRQSDRYHAVQLAVTAQRMRTKLSKVSYGRRLDVGPTWLSPVSQGTGLAPTPERPKSSWRQLRTVEPNGMPQNRLGTLKLPEA